MSQIYLKLSISYYLRKLVLNDNLKTLFYLEFLSELLIDKIQYKEPTAALFSHTKQ